MDGAVPSRESALTGGLEMVITATPSARTSIAMVPLAISGNGVRLTAVVRVAQSGFAADGAILTSI
jgi:hypothetical protein